MGKRINVYLKNYFGDFKMKSSASVSEPLIVPEDDDMIRMRSIASDRSTPFLNDHKISYKKAIIKILKLGVPIAFSQLVLIGRVFGEAMILARVDDDNLAANGLIEPITGSFVIISTAGLLPIAILLGQESERNQNRSVAQILQQGWIYSGIITAIATPIFIYIKYIVKLLGQSHTTSEIVDDYFSGYVYGLFPILGIIVNRDFFNGLNLPKYTLFLSIADTSFRMFLGYAFTFGDFNFPKLNAYGLGLSGSISTWTFFLISSAYIVFSEQFKDYKIFSTRPNFIWLKEILKLGFPIALIAATDLVSSLFSSFMVGAKDNNDLIPQGVSTQYVLLALIPVFSMMDTAAILVRRSISKRKFKNVKRLGNAAIIIGEIIALLFSTTFIAIPRQLFSIIYPENIDSSLINKFNNVMRINAVGLMADSCRIVSQGALFGSDDVKPPMKIGLTSLWLLGISLALVLVLVFGGQIESINMARYVGIGIGALLTFNRWYCESTEITQFHAVNADPVDTNENKQEHCYGKFLNGISGLFGLSYVARQRIQSQHQQITTQNQVTFV